MGCLDIFSCLGDIVVSVFFFYLFLRVGFFGWDLLVIKLWIMEVLKEFLVLLRKKVSDYVSIDVESYIKGILIFLI